MEIDSAVDLSATKSQEAVRMQSQNLFNLATYLETQDLSSFSDVELKMLCHCTSFENCEGYLERDDVIQNAALERLIKLIAAAHRGLLLEPMDSFECECYLVLLNYERTKQAVKGTRHLATRTRQMAREHGWRKALDIIVSTGAGSDHESAGFTLLRNSQRLDASFELFVLMNPDQFSSDAVSNAFRRLSRVGLISFNLSQ
jgi:hypothetical protein